jgi:virginiamycin B lyase
MSIRLTGAAPVAAGMLALLACNAGWKSSQILPTGESAIGSVHFKKYPIPTASSDPNRIVTGPGDALWFTEDGHAGSKIGRVTTSGTFTEFQVPGQTEPAHLASAFGNVWFTNANDSALDSITPRGQITRYAAASTTRGIVGGIRKRVWYTEFEANYVAILDISTGASAEYVVPTKAAKPYDVAFAGTTDAIWFTESGASKIGRMTGLGEFKEYPTPSQPRGLVFGPDKALWFTETSASKIGRMTLSGIVTEYSTPTRNSGPAVITVGPDGALWFTEHRASKIGRITTGGKIVEIATPDANADPVGITTGPDKHIWFVERAPSANAIVQLTMSR